MLFFLAHSSCCTLWDHTSGICPMRHKVESLLNYLSYNYNFWHKYVQCYQMLLTEIKHHKFYLQCVMYGAFRKSFVFRIFYIFRFHSNKSSWKYINVGNLKIYILLFKSSPIQQCIYVVYTYNTLEIAVIINLPKIKKCTKKL